MDEYIAIAKEKHGYNVEQVDSEHCTVCVLHDMLYDCATMIVDKSSLCKSHLNASEIFVKFRMVFKMKQIFLLN